MSVRSRKKDAADWTASDPMLPPGAWGFEADTGLFKVGDGVTRWNSLPYGVGGGGSGGLSAADGDGVFLAFDANNNVNAARPTTPAGANYIWFNVPSEPTNLGALDIWTSDTEIGGAGGVSPYTWQATGEALALAGKHVEWGWNALYTVGRIVTTKSNPIGTDTGIIEFDVALAAGTYEVGITYIGTTSGALVDVSLDGAALGTFDSYRATVTYELTQKYTGVTVASDGIHPLRLAINGKNESSLNYSLWIQAVGIKRTGA